MENQEEEKTKLKLLQIEKRVIDSEILLNELKEKMEKVEVEEIKKKIEEFSELKEKFEEIEDLIMVEQAGIIELKKIMENTKPTIPPELIERIEKIEKKLLEIPTQKVGIGIQERIKEIEDGFNSFKFEVRKIVEDVDRKISDIVTKTTSKPDEEFKFYSSGIESLKNNVENLSKKIAGIEASLSEIYKRLEAIENREETEVKELSTPMKDIKEKLKFFEEGITKLSEISDKIQSLEKKILKVEKSLLETATKRPIILE
ncbi:MAG: hypothetical protein QXX38_00795 [Candidatus Aenigmatarchaeota archaeon]